MTVMKLDAMTQLRDSLIQILLHDMAGGVVCAKYLLTSFGLLLNQGRVDLNLRGFSSEKRC